MGYAVAALTAAVTLFAAMLAMMEIGRRLGARAGRRQATATGIGAIDGAVFGLLGLLVAFTFSGAMNRFDQRRAYVVEEANAIGTAYLRLDLLPVDTQPALRDIFRRYLDSRLEVYRLLPDLTAARKELARSTTIQQELWRAAVAVCRAGSSTMPGMLLLPAINDMLDITTVRTMTADMHPPPIIFIMLIGMALAASLLAGYGMAATPERPWLHMVGLAAALAIAVYVILDTEYPRFGLIRVDAIDEVLVNLRASMN